MSLLWNSYASKANIYTSSQHLKQATSMYINSLSMCRIDNHTLGSIRKATFYGRFRLVLDKQKPERQYRAVLLQKGYIEDQYFKARNLDHKMV